MRTVLLSALLIVLATLALSAQSRRGETSGIVTAAQVNGTWSYNENTFKILALGKGKLKVEFEGVYPYLDASGEETANTGSYIGVAKIEGRVATITMEDYPDCTITMTFTGRELVVIEDGSFCGFGNNVTSRGTYVRESKRRPRFSE